MGSDRRRFDDVARRRVLVASAIALALMNLAALAVLVTPANRNGPESAIDLTRPSSLDLLAPASDEAYQARPLFSASRKGAVQRRAVAELSAMLRLKATSIADDRRTALFDARERPLVMEIGDAAEGVRLLEVTQNSVVVEINGQRRTVVLGGAVKR